MFLHEISHLYCTQNEILGGHFFDKYCMGSGVEDGMINAGYVIWREAIADIMADSILSEFPSLTLVMAKDEICNLNREITFTNPCSKKAMSLVIVEEHNLYFLDVRVFELAEVKPLVDAVQSSRFIPTKKSRAQIEKLSTFVGPHQSNIPKRQLYVDKRFKANNDLIFYIADNIHKGEGEKP